MLQLAHVADVHFGFRFGKYNYEDVKRSFEEILEILNREHIRYLIISGDLFDSPRPPNKVLIDFRQSIKGFLDSGGKVFAVRGEHDSPKIGNEKDAIELISNFFGNSIQKLELKKGEPNRLEIDGKEFNIFSVPSFPWNEKIMVEIKRIMQVMEEKAKNLSGKKVFVAHIPVRDFFRPFNPAFSINDLPKYMDYYALGHFHNRYKLNYEGIPVAYSGSIEILREDERSHAMKFGKGFYIVDLSSDLANIQEVNIEYRTWGIFEGKDIDEISKEIERFLEELKKGLGARKKPEPRLTIKVTTKEKLRKVQKAKYGALLDRLSEKFVGIINRNMLEIKFFEEENQEILSKIAEASTAGGEVEFVASAMKEILGLKSSDFEVAKLIVELKNCLNSSRTPKDCEDVISMIVSSKVFSSMYKDSCVENSRQEEGSLARFIDGKR